MEIQLSHSLLATVPALVTLMACEEPGRKATGSTAAVPIYHDADIVLNHFYNSTPRARILPERAKGILAFPRSRQGWFCRWGRVWKRGLAQAWSDGGLLQQPRRRRLRFAGRRSGLRLGDVFC